VWLKQRSFIGPWGHLTDNVLTWVCSHLILVNICKPESLLHRFQNSWWLQ